MNFYKLVIEEKIIGVASDDDFRRCQEGIGVLLFAVPERAQYIENNGTLYHDDWMRPPAEGIAYSSARVSRISAEEHETLSELFAVNETVSAAEIDTEHEMESEKGASSGTNDEPERDITLPYVKEAKVKQLSRECRETIVKGFDTELSDGKTHHFSLTTEDQINMIKATQLDATGAKEIPYHADGEPFRFYSPADIAAIINGANRFVTFHTAYFNSVKTWIHELEDTEQISGIRYGQSVPEQYQSEVLKELLQE